MNDDVLQRLSEWFRVQLGDAEDVSVEGLEAVSAGHSAEMLALTLTWRSRRRQERQDVVVRLRPPEPGLLEPYDLPRQFEILRALEPTEVRVPRALWLEPSGEVLGRAFYVMERVPGDVYERVVPPELASDAARARCMCENFVDQLAAIHLVDLDATHLQWLGDGSTYLDRELDRWTGEMRRVQRGPLPALERLADELHKQRPEATPLVTLVHGDAKPGNFAFVGDNVSAVFDWELTDVGDPLADIGYAEFMWALRVGLPSVPGALTADELVARWEERTGIAAHDRPWYRAFQSFKTLVIMLVGAMHFDQGHSDDPRLAEMGTAIPFLVPAALRELGVDEELDAGPVTARSKSKSTSTTVGRAAPRKD